MPILRRQSSMLTCSISSFMRNRWGWRETGLLGSCRSPKSDSALSSHLIPGHHKKQTHTHTHSPHPLQRAFSPYSSSAPCVPHSCWARGCSLLGWGGTDCEMREMIQQWFRSLGEIRWTGPIHTSEGQQQLASCRVLQTNGPPGPWPRFNRTA